MIEVRQSSIFTKWLSRLRDTNAYARIATRLERIEDGNFGDVKSAGEGVMEARIDYGPGYRLYFVRRGNVVVIMLCGGDKRTQNADIAKAKELAKEF